jgi:hypothetical protein
MQEGPEEDIWIKLIESLSKAKRKRMAKKAQAVLEKSLVAEKILSHDQRY